MEFVMTMPILFFLIMFVLQLSYLQLAHACTAYAAFCAARSLKAANVAEYAASAQSAAEKALSWFHARELKSGGKAEYEIPGWGKVPGSDTVADHVRATVDLAMLGLNASGRASLAVVEVAYDCPLMMPVVGEVMAACLREKAPDAGGTKKDGESFPFVTVHETCVLPLPYSTVDHPLLGYVL